MGANGPICLHWCSTDRNRAVVWNCHGSDCQTELLSILGRLRRFQKCSFQSAEMLGKKVPEATPISGQAEPEGPRDSPKTLKFVDKTPLFLIFQGNLGRKADFQGKNPKTATWPNYAAPRTLHPLTPTTTATTEKKQRFKQKNK